MKSIRIDKSQATYFETDGSVIASVGPMASTAMFRLDSMNRETAQWLLLDPNSPKFDYFHQYIFRNQHASLLAPEEIEKLPELPDEVSYAPKSKEDYHRPAGNIKADDYPALTRMLLARPSKASPVYVVLKEDTYETSCGDGCYRYLDSVYLDRTAAEAHIAAIDATEWYRGYLRQLTIAVADECLDIPDFELALFDNFKVADVFNLVNERLDGLTRPHVP